MPSPIHIERTVALPVAPDRLWPILADTESVNRLVGLPPVSYRSEPLEGGRIRTWAQARLYGLTFEWEEKPFEWTSGRQYEVERIFRSGLLDRMCGGVRLAQSATGTDVTVYGDFTARHGVLVPVVRALGTHWIKRMSVLFTGVGERSAGEASALPGREVRVDGEVVAQARRRLSGLLLEAETAILERLVGDLASLPDAQVLCMRPFAWADRQGVSRMAALRVFLHATTAGLLDMDWTVVCPHCRGATTARSRLADLPQEGSCPTCQVRFAVEFDRAVEGRFSVAPGVRCAVAGLYCRGGPMNQPFILAQYRIPAGGRRDVLGDVLSEGVGVHASGPLERRHDPLSGVTQFSNPSACEIVLSFEASEWQAQAATAAVIATLPIFQHLFAADVLGPGQEVAVRRLVVLFSDLHGSTALYRQIGDARALALVRAHFRAFEEILAAHEGALVKTIGDSVMAVFLRAQDALAAAAKAHASCAFPVLLKVGIHAGPLLAVSANQHNDYFGTTVNIAARLKDLAEAGQTILSGDVAEEIAPHGQRESVRLKGIEHPVDILRVGAGLPLDVPVRPGLSS